MYKKLLVGFLLLFLATASQPGCRGETNKETGNKTAAGELTGSFSGPAGCLHFYQGGSVLVNLADDFVWLLEKEENNQRYGYVFIHRNEQTSYDHAEAIFLYNYEDTFAKINCRAEKNKIVFYPGGEAEAVFEKEDK